MRNLLFILFVIIVKNYTHAQEHIISSSNEIVLSNIPKDIKIIGLGDPTHQESTITKYRIDLIKKLVDQRNFKIIALEGNMYELYNAYVKYIQTNDSFFIENAMYSQLNFSEMEELYQFVYDKNKNGEPIILIGFDSAFSGNTYAQNIREQLETISCLTKDEKEDFVEQLDKGLISNLNALFRNNKKIKTKILFYTNKILNDFRPVTESDYIFVNALQNLVFIINNKMNETSDNIRDMGMAANILFLEKQFPNQKIILFGSNTHLLKNPKEIKTTFFQADRLTLGDFLDKHFKNEYYFLAYSAISGERWNVLNKSTKLPDLDVNSIEYKYKDVATDVFLNEKVINTNKTYCRFLGHSFVELDIWKVMDGLVLIDNVKAVKVK